MHINRSRVAVLLGTLLAAAVVAVPAPAQAAVVTVTIKYGNWNCTGGGSVAAVMASIDTGGETTAWVPGNSVRLWAPTGPAHVTGAVLCVRPWYQGGSYYRYSLYRATAVNFSGQTIWL